MMQARFLYPLRAVEVMPCMNTYLDWLCSVGHIIDSRAPLSPDACRKSTPTKKKKKTKLDWISASKLASHAGRRSRAALSPPKVAPGVL